MNFFALDVPRSALVVWTALRFLGMPFIRYLLGSAQRGAAYPVRIRLALEYLGMTYLKLGQFMAMRFDILPMEVCIELRKLFENVPSLPFATIRAVVETELGRSLEDLFSRFEVTPVAAASIAQVHEAYEPEIGRLAVKVQRPGIARLFETDMRILARVAALIDWSYWLPGISAAGVISEFATYTRREMNFVLEGQTADRLRMNATKNEKVPEIYWAMTTSKVLTMEFIRGLSVSQAGKLLREQGLTAVRRRIANFSPEAALHNFAFASLHQLFGTGFFHADPHPGNILLLDDNKIAFVDFGIFGILTKSRRDLLAAYTGSVASGDIEQAYRYYAKLSVPSGRTNLETFKRETRLVLQKWYDASNQTKYSFRERHVGQVVGGIMAVLQKNAVRIDLDTLLFWRAAIALDSSALSLSEDFDLIQEIRQYFEHQRRSLGDWLGQTPERTASVMEMLSTAPVIHQETIDKLARDSFILPVSGAEGEIGSNRDKARATRSLLCSLLLASVLPILVALDESPFRDWAIAAMVAGVVVNLMFFKI